LLTVRRYLINCKTGGIEVEEDPEEQTLNVIEESKTVPKKGIEVNKTTVSRSGLSGFIERDSNIGKIEVDGFRLAIKGLNSEYEEVI
jgi:hypothetical protein